LAMVLSSAKISESKTISQLSEKVRPAKELSEIFAPSTVSSLLETKPTEPNDNRINSYAKKDLIKSDSVGKPLSDKATNLMLNEVSVIAYPSNDTTDTRKIFTNVEVLPSFPGGIEAFGKFLSQHLKYPDVAKKANIQGRVFCQFVVEKDGSLSNLKVVRGIGGGCDEEAVRVLAISPKWKPGLQKGEVVRVSYTIPIFFKIAAENIGIQLDNTIITVDKSSKNIPLVILDGLEDVGGMDKLNESIKPADIESINVLKGEASIKKYGDKGKNGVVEITTKKK